MHHFFLDVLASLLVFEEPVCLEYVENATKIKAEHADMNDVRFIIPSTAFIQLSWVLPGIAQSNTLISKLASTQHWIYL
jgi:hypothetical protein